MLDLFRKPWLCDQSEPVRLTLFIINTLAKIMGLAVAELCQVKVKN